MNFAKFSRTLFFKEHLRWLLLVERSINKSQEKERIKRSLCINYWLRKQNSLSITLIILFRLIIVKLDNFFFLSPKTFFQFFNVKKKIRDLYRKTLLGVAKRIRSHILRIVTKKYRCN